MTTDVTANSGSYVLVVDSGGETDIAQLSYDYKWDDVSVMLQIKFGYENAPAFTYTDDEEDFIILDSQEAYGEAMKICKKNNDVLHVQMREKGVPFTKSQRHSQACDDAKSTSSYHLEMARTVVGNTLDWATSKVKSVMSRGVHSNSINENSRKQSLPTVCTVEESVLAPDQTFPEDPSIETSSPCGVFNEVDGSETSVKEPLQSHHEEISVPVSLMSNPSECEQEVVVKTPITPTPSLDTCFGSAKGDTSLPREEIIQKIKEEVKLAISKEMEEVRKELLQARMLSNTGCATVSEKDTEMSFLTTSADQEPETHPKHFDQTPDRAQACQQGHTAADLSSLDARKYAASFICENLLDGSCVEIGQSFVKYWVLKNQGTTLWDHLIELKLVDETPSGIASPVDPATISGDGNSQGEEVGRQWGPEHESFPIPIVESNGIVVLAVSHIAPNFPCVYTSAWRLCHNERYFGPRIWCTVDVKNKSERQSQTAHVTSSAECEQHPIDRSYIKLMPPNEESVMELHDDNFSSMLSFEMTAVADFNECTSPARKHDENNDFTRSPVNQTTIKQHAIDVAQASEDAGEIIPQHASSVRSVEKQTTSHFESLDSNVPVDAIEKELQVSLPMVKTTTGDVSMKHEGHHREVEDANDCQIEGTNDSSDVDDVSSVISDFEVVPLPECFDTSKPLGTSEHNCDEDETRQESSINLQTEESTTEATVNQDVGETQPDQMEVDQTEGDTTRTENLPCVPGQGTALCDSNVSFLPPPGNVEVDENSATTASNVKPIACSSALTEPILDRQVDQTLLPSSPVSVINGDEPHSLQSQPVILVEEESFQSIPLPPHGVSRAERSLKLNQSSTQRPCSSNSTADVMARPASNNQDTNLRFSLPSVESDAFPVTDGSSQDNESEDVILAPETHARSDPSSATSNMAISVSTEHIGEIATAPTEQTSPSNQMQVQSSPLEQLVDMGFLDIELNYDLLNEFEGDLNRVVHALVYGSRGEPAQSRRPGPYSDGSYAV